MHLNFSIGESAFMNHDGPILSNFHLLLVGQTIYISISKLGRSLSCVTIWNFNLKCHLTVPEPIRFFQEYESLSYELEAQMWH